MHAVLARRADWLLVFDNVAGPAAVQRVLPPPGGGRVLIASQYPPGREGPEVPVLDRGITSGYGREGDRIGCGAG